MQPFRRKTDIERIKRVLSKRPRDLALFVVGINAGLRGSDLLVLRWSDVLGRDGAIREIIELSERKTGNRRKIAVSDAMRQALHGWFHEVGASKRDGLLFPGRDGAVMSIQRLHQLVNEWAELASLRGNWGSHSLRKTYGYFLYQQGVGVALLMKMFGHSSQSITLRYIGIEQEDIDEANLNLNL